MNSTGLAIIYSCPFVPPELIAAHGMRPCRIVPRACGGSGSGEGVCGYVRGVLDEALRGSDAAAVVLTTTCDQMRRAADLLPDDFATPLFLMHVPKTWQGAEPRAYYIGELRRLGRFLVRHGGREPDGARLAQVMLEYDGARERLRSLRGVLTGRQFSEALEFFHGTGQVQAASTVGWALAPQEMAREQKALVGQGPPYSIASEDVAAGKAGKIPVAIVGESLCAEARGLRGRIETAGGEIVLDATGAGERTLAAPFDQHGVADDPLGALADAYFGSIPDAFRRPNSALYDYLGKMLPKRGVRGLIMPRHIWCDTWHGETQRLKEWADIPVLDLELAGGETLGGHLSGRIEAFLEILR